MELLKSEGVPTMPVLNLTWQMVDTMGKEFSVVVVVVAVLEQYEKD